jgi:hypothetical protein
MSCQHRMEKSMDHRCPRCQRFQETLTYVFQCLHGPSICATAWAKAISTFKKTFSCPFIVSTLGYGISQWSTGGLVQWQGPTPALDDSIGQVVFAASRNNSPLVENKPSKAGSANIGGELIPCTVRRGYIRMTLHFMQYGLRIWSQECGNMELISGWARMNFSMERPRKKNLQRKSKR